MYNDLPMSRAIRFEPKGTKKTKTQFAKAQKDVFKRIGTLFARPCVFTFENFYEHERFIVENCELIGFANCAHRLTDVHESADNSVYVCTFRKQFHFLYVLDNVKENYPDESGHDHSIIVPDAMSAIMLKMIADDLFGSPDERSAPIEMSPAEISKTRVQPADFNKRNLAVSLPGPKNPFRSAA